MDLDRTAAVDDSVIQLDKEARQKNILEPPSDEEEPGVKIEDDAQLQDFT